MPGRAIALLAMVLGACGLSAGIAPAAVAAEVAVDMQLVLAADSSGSMSAEQRRVQRDGSAAAFRHPALQQAILSGPTGRIAVTYVEWSGRDSQRVVVPWRLLDSPAAMNAFAADLAGAQMSRPGSRTSISGVLLFAAGLLESNGYASWRSVIDLSANGINDQGPSPAAALAMLAMPRLTVNGLAFAGRDDGGPFAAMLGRLPPDVTAYLRREVIAGPGAFVMEVGEESAFAEAMRQKLIREILTARLGPGGTGNGG